MKDYLGNELQVGDEVIFVWPDCTFQEGRIEKIEDTEDEEYLVITTENPYNNMFVWRRGFNHIIKKLAPKQKQKNEKNSSLPLHVYTMYDKFVEYRDASCEVKEFKDKLFLYVYSNSDNSVLALWNMDSIYGYSFEEKCYET